MSTYEKVRQFLDNHIVRIGSIVVLVAVGAAVAGAFIQPLQGFLVDQRVYEVLIVALLIDIITRLADLQSVPPLRLMKNQSESMPVLIQHIREKQPKTVKMFEYSTYTIGDLLRELVDKQIEIKLLIFNPFNEENPPISDLQSRQIKHQLDVLEKRILQNYPKVEIRLYSTPASLRGRRFGNLLNLGWYTYSHKEGVPDITGGENPMLLIDAATTTEGAALAEMFDWAFDEAWQNGIPLDEARQKNSVRLDEARQNGTPPNL